MFQQLPCRTHSSQWCVGMCKRLGQSHSGSSDKYRVPINKAESTAYHLKASVSTLVGPLVSTLVGPLPHQAGQEDCWKIRVAEISHSGKKVFSSWLFQSNFH